ncbi:MAG: magnesium-translocating P-type ATPase [Coriobacteriia bacterium]|nr:magnesium-translocating P-type ATPase [Coriobacteriia bacterium]
MTTDQLYVKYNVAGRSGHDNAAAERARERYGSNVVARAHRFSLLKQLFSSFINPFTVVLLAIAIVSFVTDFILAAPGSKSLTEVIIIVVLVTISGTLSTLQETRSGKAAEALSAMIETTIAVMRNSDSVELPIDQIVVGDVVLLAAGDMIPADMRVLQAKDLFIGQSSLTGESEPVEKFSDSLEKSSANPLDDNNLVFMGSNVVSGSATCMVLAVGGDTYFGQIAKTVTTTKTKTGFEVGVNKVSWLLIRFMLVMVPIVLFVNGFTKGDWMQAVLFALSVAVGLTPEMLPMIVSANLARGAVTMSHKKVIVKNLGSIQNFGGMDFLCTDKTGTLTQDKITLEYSLDVNGNPDTRVLRHGFLNSYFQTGLRNLLDQAIIDHGHDVDISHLKEEYHKVDEIPFDFQRRRMSVVVEDQSGKTQMITKGAIEEMLDCSGYVDQGGGKVEKLTDALRSRVMTTVEKYNAQGMRVLGIAQKTNPRPAGEFSVADEADMVLIGYLAFLDPPKESSKAAIAALSEHGVGIKVLTGDNDAVTRSVCSQLGIEVSGLMLGSQVESMSDDELKAAVEGVSVFAKLSPAQKQRIVSAVRANGHTVGYMGDGINDASAMKASDVGISVDTAVDIAKESANIILMEKDLMVLEQGVVEGRKVYANIIKYIKLTCSSNFGNMFSVLAASIFLPFLPLLPLQILLLNMIYNITCTSFPFDNVDEEFLAKPRNWDASTISSFMAFFGPTSSVFDITTYLVAFFWLAPLAMGAGYHALGATGQAGFIAQFHSMWFIESLLTQTMVLHTLRTAKIPFIQSRASLSLILFSIGGILVGGVLPYTPLAATLGFARPPLIFYAVLLVTIVAYLILVSVVKKFYTKRYGELY